MAKKFHSGMLSNTSGFANMPQEIIRKAYDDSLSSELAPLNDRYSAQEEQIDADRAHAKKQSKSHF